MTSEHEFTHNRAAEAEWKPGLRDIFDYRDLGVKAATNGDYIAHVIRANGRHDPDAVQQWHVHHCDFQFLVYHFYRELQAFALLVVQSPQDSLGV